MKKVVLGLISAGLLIGQSFAVENPPQIQQYIKECESGKKTSCIKVSIYSFEVKNYKQAFDFSKKACDLNSGHGCSMLGYHYLNGLGTKKDDKKAYEIFKKACQLNDSTGCNNLAAMYFEGKVVKKDRNKAEKLYEKACKMRNTHACVILEQKFNKKISVKEKVSEIN